LPLPSDNLARAQVVKPPSQFRQSLVARFYRGRMKKESGMELLGPMPSPIERLRRKYRRQILIKSDDVGALHGLLSQLDEAKTSLLAAACSVAIDIDPENIL